MPVAYNSAPPAFQIDPQSVQNFTRARSGQGFNGVFNVQTGMVYFHPYAPSIEEVEFQRDGAVTSCAVPVGPTGGGHAWVMFMVARDVVNQKNYAGFSLIKGDDDLKITFRSGLNTESFTGRPADWTEEQLRVMPSAWAIALSDFLNANLPLNAGVPARTASPCAVQ